MASEKPWRWRLWLSVLGWSAVFVSTAMAARRVHGFALTSPRFLLEADRPDALTITGTAHAPRKKVAAAFHPDFGKSVFAVSLPERRRRLLAIDWVEDAVVSRIWPNRLVVQVIERKPVAFVDLGARSRVLLIDTHGVLLERPPQAQFAFPVLRGIAEEQTEKERRLRVALMLHVLEGLGPAAKDISEVDVSAIDNVKIVALVENRSLELMLGDTNHAVRYHNFLNYYPEIRNRMQRATGFDLRLDDRITAMDPIQ
jgi:cell division septal protein FtsQ